MILPEHLDDAKYRKHWSTATGYKILDNGAAESGALSPEQLMGLAVLCEADEVVVPDHIGRGDRTLRLVRRFKEAIDRLVVPEDIKFMAVAQGAMFSEVYRCIEYYLEQDWINTIGFPRALQVWGDGSRYEAISYWVDEILRLGKEVHCLGSTQDLLEVRELATLGESIRGIDTCMPIDVARAGVSLSQGDGKARYMGRSEGYFDWEPDAEANSLVVSNCNTYLEWAEPEEVDNTDNS